MPSVTKLIDFDWNIMQLATSSVGFSYGLGVQQIHLARYVKELQGSLDQLRSTNQYNVYYRALGNEFIKSSKLINTALFNLFLKTSDFETLKTKWSIIFAFPYNKAYTEDQYRQLLYGLRDAYINRPSAFNIKKSLQTILQLDSSRVKVYEFFKDSAIILFFTQDWLMRNDATFLFTGSTTSSTSTTLVSNSLSAYGDDQLKTFKVIITSGAGIGQVRTIIGNVQSTKRLTVDSAWTINPSASDTFTVSIFKHVRNDLASLRPNLTYYNAFGLSNYGFQVWVSVDDYLSNIGFISEIIKRIKQEYTIFSIAYILHETFAGSLTTAILNPATNPSFIAIGTGDPSWDPFNPQPTGSETSLYAENFRTIALVNYINPDETPSVTPTDYLELSGFFAPGQGTSTRVMEVGVYAEDGTTLLFYKAFTAINKQALDAFIWKFRIKYDSL